ncbi:DUF3820 family protein [Catenovulum sp. 2E275]|uniref:DUF3820 family protein n=1 Tax=Catenovulum sp. 2E275 TaxID=2980497 RepID=UPI0021D23283|nr:DUF3820 family protein [Catenovulum sp. 2E275]MCU4676976.1 DUF3820 family protein [Catenovulum sp. 2E275]
MQQTDLIKIANTQMPFGKYAGRALIDLPEEYLLWFQKKEWPKGELGHLMQITLAVKMENLDYLIKPLKAQRG